MIAQNIFTKLFSPFLLPLKFAKLGQIGAGGGGLGGLLAGAAGGPAGVALGVGTGLLQLGSSLAQKKKAQEATPTAEDPELRRFLNEIDRRRRTFETGAAFQAGSRALRTQQAATQQGILKAGGGDIGASISGLARSQRGTQSAFNELVGRAEARQDQMTQLFGSVLNRIAQRRLELGLLAQSKAEAQAASSKRQGQANILQSLTRLLPVGAQGAAAGVGAMAGAGVGPGVGTGVDLSAGIGGIGATGPAVGGVGDLTSQIIGAQGNREQLANLLGLIR